MLNICIKVRFFYIGDDEIMRQAELPVESMFPRIFYAREFEFKKTGPEKGGRVSFVYELGFYLGGDGKIVIGDNEYDVHFGDIRFVPPGTFLNSVPEYRCYTVTFDFGESNTIYKNQIIDSIPEYFQTTGELLKQFEELVKSVASTEAVEKIRQGAKLMQLISDIFEMFHLEKKYCKAVRACISYMEENYNDAITLKQLGEISGYSDIHTMRLFRRDTGQTPHEWLTNIRINRARELLTASDKTLEQIASECGFSSDSHFKILFKKTTGITPGAYRRGSSSIY